MKKTVALAIFVLFAWSGMAFAVPEDNVGCGFGTMIFEGEDGLASQVCAVTTNGLASNTVSISMGTFNCNKPRRFWSERATIYVAENMDNLAMDIAAGQGETLDTLAEIIEIPSEERSDFYASLQLNFDTIYPSGDVTHHYVVDQIRIIVEKT